MGLDLIFSTRKILKEKAGGGGGGGKEELRLKVKRKGHTLDKHVRAKGVKPVTECRNESRPKKNVTG